MANRNAWHTMDIDQICARLETNATTGLGRKQASARAKKLIIRQPDALKSLFLPPQRPLYRDLGKMLLDPIMLLTLFIAAIAFLFGKYTLGGAILIILLVNAVCCALANAKANSIRHKLQLYSNPMIKIIRSGKLYTTDARNVLPGDVVILGAGDICPADVRLEKGCSLRVLQYTHDQTDISRVSVQKSGDILYQPGQEIFNPNCDNIVYAGSVIEQGFARGIAVETGLHTYIGALNGTVPETNHIPEPQSISFIKRYYSYFSGVQAALILPLTILLAMTMRYSLSFVECFLTTLALCCTAITGHIVSLAQIIRAAGIEAAASEEQNASVAIVKNSSASDKLCVMTDLLLLDSSAISDGKYHLESVYACGSIYNINELHNSDVYRLVSDLYLYRTATRPLESFDRDTFDVGLTAPIDALIKHVSLDTTAIDLTKVSSHITFHGDTCTVHTQLNSGEHEVLLSQNEYLLQHCTHVASADKKKDFDDSEHIALRTLCRIYRESGYRILLVANRREQCVTLVGVLAFAQRSGFGFNECCEQLMHSGVRVSAFMQNTNENMKILSDSGLVRDQETDVLTVQAAREQGLDLHVAYGSYRAYLGFSESQIAELIQKLRQRGGCVASYCVDNQSQELHSSADLTVTCDAIEYRSSKAGEALYDKMPVDGKSFSSRASQNMRRTSDIIVRRAGDQGGGLHGILTGRKYSFAINLNLANAMTYLITVQFFRAVLLIVPAMFGVYSLTAVSLLICGLILDVAAVILFAFAAPNQKSIASSYSIMRRLEKPIAYNAANVISACVSALLIWLAFTLLQAFNIADASQSAGLGFVSTYLLQGVVFMITLQEYSAGNVNKKRKSAPVLLAYVSAFILLLCACVMLPGINELTGGNTLSWTVTLIAPLASLVYYVTYRILSARGLNLHK